MGGEGVIRNRVKGIVKKCHGEAILLPILLLSLKCVASTRYFVRKRCVFSCIGA